MQFEDNEPRVGDRVFAFGSPFGIKFSMSEGIISGLSRGDAAALRTLQSGYTNFIQTDAAINPGNSGGPLVDTRGHVVGMSTAIANGVRDREERVQGQSAGIGFAIPVRTIEKVAQQLIDGTIVIRGYLGITLPGSQSINRRAMLEQGFEGAGVYVGGAPENQPASKAGVQQGDIIISVDGEPTPTVAVLRSVISLLPPGEEVSFTLWRDGETLDVGVELGAAINVDVRGPADLRYIPGSEDMSVDELKEAAERFKRRIESEGDQS
jgi:serine protease Do